MEESTRIIRDTRIHKLSTGWKPKHAVVKVQAVPFQTVLPYLGTVHNTAHGGNSKVDPVVRATAAQLLFTRPDLCFHPDGTFNPEGFKAAFDEFMRSDVSKPNIRRFAEQEKRR